MMIFCKNTFKRKQKRKPKAEREAYEKRCEELGFKPYSKTIKKVKSYQVETYKATETYRRDEKVYESVKTVVLGSCAPRKDKMFYTGDKLLGIAHMHKSNFVPVYSGDDAISLATMRRN